MNRLVLGFMCTFASLALSSTALAKAPLEDKDISNPAPAQHQQVSQPESGTTLPVPPGWHAHKEVYADKLALFVSKEDIKANGGFLTGFSLNYFSDFHAKKGMKPSEYAAMFASQAMTSNPGSKITQAELAPGIVVHEIRVSDAKREPVTMLLYLAAGDDRSDTLRLAWYESPESSWDAEWVYGETIINEFLRGIVRASSN